MRLHITGAWREAEQYRDEIEKLGHTISFQQYESEEVNVDIGNIEGLICSRSFFNHHDISKFSSLKYIQITASGTDGMPIDYIESRGIKLNTAVGVYSIPIAEHALATVLAVYRQLPAILEQQREKIWNKKLAIRELYGSTVLIVGLGSIGSACAERFAAMGCKVIGLHRDDKVEDHLGMADIIILSTALTEETRGLINAEKASLIKRDAVVVSLGREEIITAEALNELTSSDNDIVVIMDCYRQEPLDSKSELWNKQNVIVSPHVSYKSPEDGKRLGEVIVGNLSIFTN